MSELIGRRSFLTGLAAVIAAPAIVRVSSIMPVRGIIMDTGWADYGRSPAMAAIWSLKKLQNRMRAPIIRRVSFILESHPAPDQSLIYCPVLLSPE